MSKSNIDKRFKEIVRLGAELNLIQDYDILLERILFSARKIVNADAGTIYVRDQDSLVFNHTQNQTLQNKLPPGKKLIYTIFKIPINKKSISGYAAVTGKIINIPDVYQLSKRAPYHFNPEIDKVSEYRTQSILTIPMKNSLNEVIGVLQIINAQDKNGNIIPFKKKDEPLMVHFANTASLVLQKTRMTRELLIRMIQMAELHDPKETGPHVNRVASYAVELYERWAKKNNIQESELEKNRDILRMAAMLHDVGKVAITDLILKKPSRFTEEEFKIMKAHTYLGASLFKDKQSEFDEIAAIVALNHHENWDGTGYPGFVDVNTGKPLKVDDNGNILLKRGNEIPIFGRIVALADVFDALSSKRVYKSSWEEKDVINEIRAQSGKKFDPELVEIFFESLDLLKSLAEKYKED